MTKLTVNIPEPPKNQCLVDISLHFLDGQLVEYTAPSGWDIEKQEPCEELDFVQPHKKIAVNLEVCKMRRSHAGRT